MVFCVLVPGGRRWGEGINVRMGRSFIISVHFSTQVSDTLLIPWCILLSRMSEVCSCFCILHGSNAFRKHWFLLEDSSRADGENSALQVKVPFPPQYKLSIAKWRGNLQHTCTAQKGKITMAQKLYFWAWVLQFGKVKVQFLPIFLTVLGGNLNVTARKPGCIHHLTLFLLGWLVREFPVCRKVLCFGKNTLFQVDWNTICCIWQSEWNKVQEVFIAAWKEILSDLTFMMLEVTEFTKGHVLTFLWLIPVQAVVAHPAAWLFRIL